MMDIGEIIGNISGSCPHAVINMTGIDIDTYDFQERLSDHLEQNGLCSFVEIDRCLFFEYEDGGCAEHIIDDIRDASVFTNSFEGLIVIDMRKCDEYYEDDIRYFLKDLLRACRNAALMILVDDTCEVELRCFGRNRFSFINFPDEKEANI